MLQLSRKFAELCYLESFSITITRAKDYHMPIWEISELHIKILLGGLRMSVKCLEINAHRHPTHLQGALRREEDHLRLSLRQIFPRIDNARLRLTRCCQAIIPDSSSEAFPDRARSTQLVLNLCEGRRCSTGSTHLGMSDYDPSRHTSDLIVSMLKEAIKKGTLSNFSRCLVYDKDLRSIATAGTSLPENW